MPYFAQWESKDLVGKILRNWEKPVHDLKWKESGAKTKEEYDLWTRNMCGMACLKMILAYKMKKQFPLVTLGKACMQFGGYKMTDKKRVIDGLFYEPFVRFVKETFGISAKLVKRMPQEQVIYELSKGNMVIASVSPQIRHPKEKNTKNGGHLVLMLGYDLGEKMFFLHNPSGDTKENQEYFKISFTDFTRFSASRGIVIN